MPKIAKRCTDITASWIDEILRSAKILTDPEQRVTAIAADLIGNGNMGQVVRVSLTYSNPKQITLPRSVAVKLAAESQDRRNYAVERGIYNNEVRFYRDIASTVGILVPHCYFAEIEPLEGWFNLVLEDLSGTTHTGDSIAGCTLAQAKLILSELAKLHAPRWNDPLLAQAMDSPSERIQTHKQFDGYLDSAEQAITELKNELRTDQIDLIQAVMPLATQWLTSWQAPFAIQHGDFRLDNMLFGSTPSAPPFIALDWQIVRVGPPLVDVAYFLGECLSAHDRRKYEHDLLKVYHQGLVSGGVGDYDYESLWLDYKRYSLFGIFAAVGTYRRIQHTEYSRKLFINSIQKYADLALDLDAIATLTGHPAF